MANRRMNVDYQVWAENFNGDMVIYMADEFGQRHFVMKHRSNDALFMLLNGGTTLSKLYQYKPTRNKREQSLYNTIRYIIKVVNWLALNELAA